MIPATRSPKRISTPPRKPSTPISSPGAGNALVQGARRRLDLHRPRDMKEPSIPSRGDATLGSRRPAFDSSPTPVGGSFLFDPDLHSRGNSLRAVEARTRRVARRVSTILEKELQRLAVTLRSKVVPGTQPTPQDAAISHRLTYLKREARSMSRSYDGGKKGVRTPISLVDEVRALIQDALDGEEMRDALDELTLQLHYIDKSETLAGPASTAHTPHVPTANVPDLERTNSAGRAARELIASLPVASVINQRQALLSGNGSPSLAASSEVVPQVPAPFYSTDLPAKTTSPTLPVQKSDRTAQSHPLSRSEPCMSTVRQQSAPPTLREKGLVTKQSEESRVSRLEKRMEEQAKELRAQTDILKSLTASLSSKTDSMGHRSQGVGCSSTLISVHSTANDRRVGPSMDTTPRRKGVEDSGAPHGRRGAVLEALSTLRDMDEERDRLWRKWIQNEQGTDQEYPVVGFSTGEISDHNSLRSSQASFPSVGCEGAELGQSLEDAIWRAQDRFEAKVARSDVVEPWKLVETLTNDVLADVVDASTAELWEASGDIIDAICDDELSVGL